jgi:hypothetical protein
VPPPAASAAQEPGSAARPEATREPAPVAPEAAQVAGAAQYVAHFAKPNALGIGMEFTSIGDIDGQSGCFSADFLLSFFKV